MGTPVNWNGQPFTVPANGERKWGTQTSNLLIAIANNALSKAGGNFTLTADTNFGATYGLVVKYLKSASSNIAQSGVVRLANNEGIGFRNAENSADLLLKVNASNELEFNGGAIASSSALAAHIADLANPHAVTKSQVGLGNADNTSDLNKPVSTAQQAALDLKANLASPTFTGTVGGITKSMVGLGNVDNTSDATKNSATAVLTNKDIDGGTASNTSRITVPKAATATLSGLTRKQGTLLYDTSLGKLLVDNGTSLDQVGSGSGAGGVTLIANPSDAGNWTETGTVFDGSPTTTTTSGDLPLAGATSSAIKITASGNGTEATNYVSYAVTTSAAMNGKLQVDFFMRPGTGFAANEWTVSVYQGSTRQALDSDSSGVTYLTNATQRITVSFDAVASTAYTLRFARVSGTGSATLNVCNAFLGWPQVSNVASVSGRQDWTPTFTGLGTPTISEAYYLQVGPRMFGYVRATSGTATGSTMTMTLPNNLTAQISTSGVVGELWRDNATLNTRKRAVIRAASGSNVLTFTNDDYSWDVSPISSSQSGSNLVGNSTVFTLEFNVLIAEWAGSVTTAPVPAEEFLSSSFSSYAAERSPQGTVLPTNTPAGVIETVSAGSQPWQFSFQSTDNAEVEMQSGGGTNPWTPIDGADIDKLRYDGTNFIGLGVYYDAAASAWKIARGKYRQGTATTWAGVAAGTRYRIRKTRKAALPFANASSVASGLTPPQTTSIDAVGVSCSQAGYTSNRRIFRAYQDDLGNWRLRFQVTGDFTSATVTSVTMTITGVTFKNVSSFTQACTGYWKGNSSVIPRVYANPNAATITLDSASATTVVGVMIEGDVELESKPSWA